MLALLSMCSLVSIGAIGWENDFVRMRFELSGFTLDLFSLIIPVMCSRTVYYPATRAAEKALYTICVL